MKKPRALSWLRSGLAVWLAALVLGASAAPCTGFAAAAAGCVITALDPCHADHHGPPALACAQVACQQLVAPAANAGAAPMLDQPVAYGPIASHWTTRSLPPPDPPPRAAMS